MSWRDICRRVERAAEQMPTPPTDPVFDPDIFTDDEVRTMEAVASRYPAGTFARGGGLSALSDDDLAAIAVIAERVKASRDGRLDLPLSRVPGRPRRHPADRRRPA